MNDDLESLREQTRRSSRAETSAAQTEDSQLKDQILTHLREIEKGDRQKTLSVWHGPMAALFAALDEDANQERLNDLARAAREELDLDPLEGDVDRSDVLRLAVQYFLQDVDPELLEVTREAVAEQAAESASQNL